MDNTLKRESLQTALVIDDDVFTQAILRKNLEQLGIEDIAVAHNGHAGVMALDAARRQPDILICDIFMPDMDGIEFIGELAKRKYQGGLILMTGVNRGMLEVASDIATLKGLTVLGTFSKPLQLPKLRELLGLQEA